MIERKILRETCGKLKQKCLWLVSFWGSNKKQETVSYLKQSDNPAMDFLIRREEINVCKVRWVYESMMRWEKSETFISVVWFIKVSKVNHLTPGYFFEVVCDALEIEEFFGYVSVEFFGLISMTWAIFYSDVELCLLLLHSSSVNHFLSKAYIFLLREQVESLVNGEWKLTSW